MKFDARLDRLNFGVRLCIANDTKIRGDGRWCGGRVYLAGWRQNMSATTRIGGEAVSNRIGSSRGFPVTDLRLPLHVGT